MVIDKKSIPNWLSIESKRLKGLIQKANEEHDDFQQWVEYDDLSIFVEITQWQTKRGNVWSVRQVYCGKTKLA